MFAKIGAVLLAAWLVGVLWIRALGEAVHVLLLVGLMLTLIGFLKAREAAVPAAREPDAPPPRDRVR